MELRHLRYFTVVAEERNFTRAAEKLFIAQPPLSRQVRQLEDELGVHLFEPGSRPLQLTEAGQFFYAHAQQLLARASEVKAMTQRIGQIEHSLSIGFVASTLYGLLPRIIRKMRADFPQVAITVHEMGTVEQIEALKTGKIDVGFGRLRVEDPNIRRIILREERLMVALPIEHRLAQQHAVLTLLDLIDEPLLIYPHQPRPSFADQVLSIFADRALKPAKLIEVRELQIALGMVAAGEGIAIVPASLYGLRRTDVQYMALTDLHAVSPIIMSTRSMDQSELLQALLEVIYHIYDNEGIAYARQRL